MPSSRKHSFGCCQDMSLKQNVAALHLFGPITRSALHHACSSLIIIIEGIYQKILFLYKINGRLFQLRIVKIVK